MYKIMGTDEKEYVPISSEQVGQWVLEGRLNGNSKIQTVSSGEWRLLRDMVEVGALLSPTAARTLMTSGHVPGAAKRLSMWAFGMGLFSFLCGLVIGLAELTGAAFFVVGPVGQFCQLCQPLAVVSIVLGANALSQFKQNPNQTGHSFAVAGIVLGIISLLGYLLPYIYGLVFVVFHGF